MNMNEKFYYKHDIRHAEMRNALSEDLGVTEAEVLRMLVKEAYTALHPESKEA
jgi:hypothetical protein